MMPGRLRRLLLSLPAAPHLVTGSRGEKVAARHLRKAGYRVIRRNLRTPVGEVDLLCLAPDRRTIVIVEVKTRAGERDGPRSKLPPELALNHAKKRKLLSIASDLIRRKRWQGRTVRIDLVAVEFFPGEGPQIRHHINAVTKQK